MVNLVKATQNSKLEESDLLVSKALKFEQAAWESSFYKRLPSKITSTNLFFSFWKLQQLGSNSLRKWSIELGKLIGAPVSKQSINERLNSQAVELAKLVLKTALNLKVNRSKLSRQKNELKKATQLFNRILIRDSTTQNLPSHLSEVFPGNHNNYKTTAVMRIQALFDFSNQKWLDFEVSSYRANDQSAAFCVSQALKPKDLLLQDLGYFTLDWLEQLIEKQYVITLWDNKTHLFDKQDQRIDLLTLLKNKKEVDKVVLVGSKKKIKMRLVARRLPKAKANKKIKSARNNRHSKANHSKEYFDLLQYEIYLTNIPKSKLNGKNIAKLYGLRWHIEILFKSWKSHANFKKMFAKEKLKEDRVKFMIYAFLIQMVYVVSKIYDHLNKQIKKITNRKLSILKFIEEMKDSIFTILKLKSLEELAKLIPIYAKCITYEQYPKRKNTIEKYLYVNEL